MQNSESNEPNHNSKPQNKIPKRAVRSTLDVLPTKLRDHLHVLIEQGLGERTIRVAMMEQFPNQIDLVGRSESSYRRYIQRYKQADSEKINDKSDFHITEPVASASGDVGTFDPCQSVVDLHKFWDERIRTLQAKMATSNDPSLDTALSQAMRMKAQALKMSMEYKEGFDQAAEKDVQHEMEQFMMVILAAVKNAYRCINGDNNFKEFYNQLDDFLEGALKYYMVSKSAYVRKDEAICHRCSTLMAS